MTKFGDTRLFAWIATTFDTTWEPFEVRLDFVRRDAAADAAEPV